MKIYDIYSLIAKLPPPPLLTEVATTIISMQKEHDWMVNKLRRIP